MELLTNIAQIKELTPGQASEGRRARVAACVVFYNSRGDCFIQDATEALYLVRPPGRQNVRLGDRIIVEGTTAPGDYAPVLVERQLEVLGSGELPEPQQVNCSQLASGQCDSKWVETEGVVRWIVDSRPSHILTQLALPDGKVRVYVFGWQEPEPQRFVGATFRVRAAAGASFNQKRQFVGPFLFVNAPDNLTLVRVGSPDASDLPLTPATALLQYRAPGQSGNRVRVRGTVTHQVPGQSLFIRDGMQGLQLSTPMTNLVGARQCR